MFNEENFTLRCPKHKVLCFNNILVMNHFYFFFFVCVPLNILLVGSLFLRINQDSERADCRRTGDDVKAADDYHGNLELDFLFLFLASTVFFFFQIKIGFKT